MKLMAYTGRYGKGTKVMLTFACYVNDRIALLLVAENGEPIFKASVNLPDEPCPPEEVWIKDWSENEGMFEFLVAEGIIERTILGMVQSGNVLVTRHRLLVNPARNTSV